VSTPRGSLLFFALALVGGACGRATPAPDAGPPDAAPTVPTLPPRPPAAPGELLADLDESRITATIIKDHSTASPVIATLMLRDGRLTLGGSAPAARVSVDLLTFDSKIALRNERVKVVFFETRTLGWDTLELEIPRLPDAALAALVRAKRLEHVTLEATVKVHGAASKLTMVVDAAYGPDGALSITTPAPVELQISTLGLTDNMRRLSKLCMHDSIEDVVRVTVSLRFPAR
jgi:hypothetical protein